MMDHGCPKVLNVVNVKASLILILANTEAEKFRKGSPSSHIESHEHFLFVDFCRMFEINKNPPVWKNVDCS